MLATLLSVVVYSVIRLTPTQPGQLVFHDDFDGPVGSSPTGWTNETGGNGWGNNELESYTQSPANSYLDGKGHLVIEARQQHTTGTDGIARDYTSARLVSKGHFSLAYGRFEARVMVPKGQGIWPAFWLLGDDIGTAGWPGCGEIDVMEVLGQQPNICHGTLHGPGYSGAAGPTAEYVSKTSLANDFHVYAVEWESGYVRWYVDGNLYHTVTPGSVAPHHWVFNHPFFLIRTSQWAANGPETRTAPPSSRSKWLSIMCEFISWRASRKAKNTRSVSVNFYPDDRSNSIKPLNVPVKALKNFLAI
ncbi:MAG TPA: glycoside hydrolase family 16 protein [Fimbriimonadaceae bacterium]|jgi:beta-glucanase (GH16 family)